LVKIRAKALGERNDMLINHELYVGLAQTSEYRRVKYRTLFQNYISLTQIENIRDATNKSWVLSNDNFRNKIEPQLNRRLSPVAKGKAIESQFSMSAIKNQSSQTILILFLNIKSRLDFNSTCRVETRPTVISIIRAP
jgi:hypothetical protein